MKPAETPQNRAVSGIYLTFGRRDSGEYLPIRFVMQYVSDSWLFMERVWAKADGIRVEPPQPGKTRDWARDNGGGLIGEWADTEVERTEIPGVRQLMNAKAVTIRFEGKQYYKDRPLTSAQQKAMRDVVNAYEAATGKPWQ